MVGPLFQGKFKLPSPLIRSFLIFSIAAICVTQAAAQGDAIVSGAIKTAAGSPIPNAKIALKNLDDGVITAFTVSPDGSYTAGNLGPGTYQLTALAPGFAAADVTVTIPAGRTELPDLVLQPQEVVAVQGAEGSSPDAEAMNSKAVGELPLNGRSTSDVAALEPGVLKARTSAVLNGPSGYGIQMAIFGGRPRENSSTLDGLNVNDYGNGPLGNAIGITLGVDALEQLSVLTSNDLAQFGRSSGGYISSATRSGGNRFHGGAFEYIRNSVLDANNYFDLRKPPFRRNQFGGSLGGPIWQDRTFFFADYEGIRQSQGVTNVSAVPSVAARAGQLSSGPVVVDPLMLRFINAFYPLPNSGLLGAGDVGVNISAGQKVTPGNHFTARIDERPSAKDSLSLVYLFDAGSVTGPDRLDNKLNENDSRQQFLAISGVRTFSPRLLNSLRFGFNRVLANSGQSFPEQNPFMSDPSFGIVPGKDAPRVDVPGLVPFEGGLTANGTYHFAWTSIQAYDDLSLTRGAHSLKLGVALERIRDNIVAVQEPSGRFTFNSLSDLLTNKPYAIRVTTSTLAPDHGFRQTVLGAYIQDEWRWRPHLALHLGLRYEMATVPAEVQDHLSVLRNLTDARPHLGSPLFANPTLRNWEPRVGFAWDPFHRNATMVSGGFGIFDVLPLPYISQFQEIFADPYTQNANVTKLPPGSFGQPGFDLALASNSFLEAYLDPHPRRNYVMQWNFTVQQELPGGVRTKVGYVGSRGVHHIFRLFDANIVEPTLTPQGYLWPSPVGSGTRLNPQVGRINSVSWIGDSYYHAFVLQASKRVGSRGQVTGSYTWAKAIDTSSGSMSADEYSNAVGSPLLVNPELNRGLSDFNVAQDLKVIYSWQLGSPPWASGLAGWTLSGWQIGGVLEASTGVPFTPTIGGDALGVNSTDPNMDVPNFVPGPGCDSPINPGNPFHYIKTQCFAAPNPITLRGHLGRNTLIGPGLVNLDVSLFKNNYIKRISDSFNAQFRAEFFNIVNHPNFNPPLNNRFVFDSKGNPVSSAGLIDSTQTSSRQIQFALRLQW